VVNSYKVRQTLAACVGGTERAWKEGTESGYEVPLNLINLRVIFEYFLFLRISLTELLDGTFLFFAKK
jgi:hypothetical protein